MDLAERLKYLRTEHGYTMDYVANALGITKSSYNRKENGDTRLLADEVPKILQLYSISYEDFYRQQIPPVNIKTIPYNKEELDELGMLTDAYESVSDHGDWNEIKNASDRLHEAMKPILKTRNDALRPPHVKFSEDDTANNITVKSVTLDLRAEGIIARAMKMEDQLYDEMFGKRNRKRKSDMNKIKFLRISHGKTIQEVANAIGIFLETYQNVEKGNEKLSPAAFERLLNFYRISRDDFFDMRVDENSLQ